MQKKKRIKQTMVFTSIAINLMLIMAMAICVYSTYLHPHYHPNWSYLGMAFPVILILNIAFIPFWMVFKWRLTTIPICGLLICGWAIRAYCPINIFTDEEEANLKFVTYNVMHMGDSTSKVAPSENPILLYLLNLDADIICIQEANNFNYKNNIDTFKTVYPYVETNSSKNNTMAILSKHPIIETLDLADSIVENRTFGYRIQFGDDTLLVLNNHFESFKLKDNDKQDYKSIIEHPRDSNTEERFDTLVHKVIAATKQRALQVDYLYKYIKNCNEKYIILCGDFNDSPISYTHLKMTEVLDDAYTRSGNGPGWSYNRSGMNFRIDNILVSQNIKPCKAKVDRSINTSDHYPLISWLKTTK